MERMTERMNAQVTIPYTGALGGLNGCTGISLTPWDGFHLNRNRLLE